MKYCEAEVACGNCAWVDPLDHKKGIIALEMLPSGKRLETLECESIDASYFNLKRVPTSPEWKNPTLPRLNYILQFAELMSA